MENPKGIAAIPILIVAVIVAALLAGGSWWYARDSKCRGNKQCTVQPVITNFSECVNIGYPATLTYPRQCTAYGVTYTEVVTNGNSNVNVSITNSSQNTNTAGSQTSYLACGCGCCGGETSIKKCIYKSKGDSLTTIQQQDLQAKQSTKCATAGCSLGTLYQYCDAEATNTNTSTNTTVSTTSWKTYTNKSLGITFTYPSTWGEVKVTTLDNTQGSNVNSTDAFRGKAQVLSFSKMDQYGVRTWLQFSSSDYKTMYGVGYYVGGKLLEDECTNPGIIKNKSFCFEKIIAGQITSDRVYFESPECSPRFVRDVRLNTQNADYPGLSVWQDFSSSASCIATSAEWDATVQSELKNLLNRNVSKTEKARMEEFDTFLDTITITK